MAKPAPMPGWVVREYLKKTADQPVVLSYACKMCSVVPVLLGAEYVC